MKKVIAEIYIQDVDAPYIAYEIEKFIKGHYEPFKCEANVIHISEEEQEAIKRDYCKQTDPQ